MPKHTKFVHSTHWMRKQLVNGKTIWYCEPCGASGDEMLALPCKSED